MRQSVSAVALTVMPDTGSGSYGELVAGVKVVQTSSGKVKVERPLAVQRIF